MRGVDTQSTLIRLPGAEQLDVNSDATSLLEFSKCPMLSVRDSFLPRSVVPCARITMRNYFHPYSFAGSLMFRCTGEHTSPERGPL